MDAVQINSVSDAQSTSQTASPPTLARYQSRAERLEERRSRNVRSEIQHLIKPYRNVSREPPFSAEEMAVMAILCSTELYLEKSEILTWILQNFKFYANKACEQYASTQDDRDYAQGLDPLPQIVPDFHHVFATWQAPFFDADGESTVMLDFIPAMPVTVPTNAGRIFLRHLLEPQRKGTFPFLKLPPELRNTIYEMIFTFPKSGFAIDCRAFEVREFHLLEREDGEMQLLAWPEMLHDYHHRGACPLFLGPTQRLFAMLSVNKQIHDEAVPFFYRLNHFYFDNFADFCLFVKRLAPSRLQHLTSIYLNATIPDVLEPKNYLQAMSRLSLAGPKLEKLELKFSDCDWLHMVPKLRRNLGRYGKFTSLEQVPGLDDLAMLAAKATELEIHGDEICEFEKLVEVMKSGGGPIRETPKKRRKKGSTAAKSAVGKLRGSDDENGEPAKKRKKS